MSPPNPFAGWDWEAVLPGLWQQVSNALGILGTPAYIAMGLLLGFFVLDQLLDLVGLFARMRDDDD